MKVMILMAIIVAVSSQRLLKITQFLMNNHELCGKPFADAEWIPVLDMCDETCDDVTEICVENDQLTQRCNKLPKECSEALIAHLNPPSKQQAKNQWETLPRIQQRRQQWENQGRPLREI